MYHLISDMRALYVCTPNGAHFEIMSWVIQPCSFPCESVANSQHSSVVLLGLCTSSSFQSGSNLSGSSVGLRGLCGAAAQDELDGAGPSGVPFIRLWPPPSSNSLMFLSSTSSGRQSGGNMFQSKIVWNSLKRDFVKSVDFPLAPGIEP